MVTASRIPEREPDVQLIMDAETARTLLALVNSVGGDYTKTYRQHTDMIRNGLREVGVTVAPFSRFKHSIDATDIE